jgi:hypothetical protein
MPSNRVAREEALDLVGNRGFGYLEVRSAAELERGHPEGVKP